MEPILIGDFELGESDEECLVHAWRAERRESWRAASARGCLPAWAALDGALSASMHAPGARRGRCVGGRARARPHPPTGNPGGGGRRVTASRDRSIEYIPFPSRFFK